MRQRRHTSGFAVAGALLAAAVLLSACASTAPAPVIERSTGGMPAAAAEPAPLGPGLYRVKKGDTLYAIALDHGQSYRDLAAWNGLADPGRIEIGQVLRVVPPGEGGAGGEGTAAGEAEAVAVAKPVSMVSGIESTAAGAEQHPAAPASAAASAGDPLKHAPKGGKLPYSAEALEKLQQEEVAAAPAVVPAVAAAAPPAAAQATPPAARPQSGVAVSGQPDWVWPGNGRLLAGFVEGGNKGIDIAGKFGEPVLAAAAGKVILVSSALRGYGNFVIVKHNNALLSVYAHNSRILIKEEQAVSKGQKIAEIGDSDADQPKLHFEIRQQGKPVDPLKFLPAR
ncbi:peptidoglycan DD-metalloendopeptidase family protein [Sterolibacterium denitrificans]|nr:peptidoglycan DD-metalloendopeptidase family protein [Sterolibacterium denitrificans]